MKRWWLLSAIGALSAVVLFQLSRPDASADATESVHPVLGAEAQPLPAVRVEQVLIHADLAPSTQREADPAAIPVSFERPVGPIGGLKDAPTRATTPSPTRLRDARTSSPMLERAKRAFLGDGRHRPEPFPRVKDN